MGKNEVTSAVVTAVLKITATGAALTVGLLAPNALIAFQKPLETFMDRLDEPAKERELQRVLRYMKSQGLVQGTYEHGLQITEKGRRKLSKMQYDHMTVSLPAKWDGAWRVVFYDIPERHKIGRDALTRKLRRLGFFPLQRSVLIHPFPCREVIEGITAAYDIDKYVSYIETPFLDNQQVLITKFKHQYPTVIM
jgi:DNA-binding transcriptional regulator PaaX